MADDIQFKIDIPNLQALMDAFKKAPEIAKPTFDKAFLKAEVVLAQNTNQSTVPYKTTNLIKSFQPKFEPLKLIWFPTALYAPFVELGTRAHEIWPLTKKALFWPGADHPYKHVNHPGTKANPYMERIVQVAQPRITEIFAEALGIILTNISTAQ